MRRNVRIERRLDASADEVATRLAGVGAWERWTPFLHSVEILQEADGILRLRVTTPLFRQGRPFDAEVILGSRSVRLRELDRHGNFVGLEGRWTWQEADDGTPVALDLTADTPFLHFRTRVLLERAAGEWMDRLEDAVAAGMADDAGATEIFRGRDDGADELRMRHRGRLYRLVPVDRA